MTRRERKHEQCVEVAACNYNRRHRVSWPYGTRERVGGIDCEIVETARERQLAHWNKIDACER